MAPSQGEMVKEEWGGQKCVGGLFDLTGLNGRP